MAKVDKQIDEQVIENSVEQIKVRVLVDCVFGKCNAVALLSQQEVEFAEKNGLVCSVPGEVAYAESLTVVQAED